MYVLTTSPIQTRTERNVPWQYFTLLVVDVHLYKNLLLTHYTMPRKAAVPPMLSCAILKKFWKHYIGDGL